MAHLICGIDLGAFSVKFAFLDVGFRTTTLRGFLEIAVPGGDEPLAERQADAMREGFSQVREATPYLAIPGDQLSVRVLQLPFTDARKIEQVVGYELEGQIVHALEDVVFDHLVVGTSAEGSTVLAAAAKRDDIAALIAANETRGSHPRALYAAPAIYHTLLPPSVTEAQGDEEALPPPTQMVTRHVRTVCVVARAGAHARVLRRLQLTWRSPRSRIDRADSQAREAALRTRPGSGAGSTTLLREALAPVQLRQTLATPRPVRRRHAAVTGGTGRLRACCPSSRPSWVAGGAPRWKPAEREARDVSAPADGRSPRTRGAIALAAAAASQLTPPRAVRLSRELPSCASAPDHRGARAASS